MYESDYNIWPATTHMISVLWTSIFMIVLCSCKSSMLLASCVRDMSLLTLPYLTFHRYLCKVDIYANVLLILNVISSGTRIITECSENARNASISSGSALCPVRRIGRKQNNVLWAHGWKITEEAAFAHRTQCCK